MWCQMVIYKTIRNNVKQFMLFLSTALRANEGTVYLEIAQCDDTIIITHIFTAPEVFTTSYLSYMLKRLHKSGHAFISQSIISLLPKNITLGHSAVLAIQYTFLFIFLWYTGIGVSSIRFSTS